MRTSENIDLSVVLDRMTTLIEALTKRLAEKADERTSIRTSEKIDLFAIAFTKAQGSFPPIKKSKINKAFNSPYADLDDVLAGCIPTLAANDLSFIQSISNDDKGNLVVTTRVMHKSGQWMESDFSVKPEKPTLQGQGSAISYARRYTAKAMLGLGDDDDDGEAAMNRQKDEQAPPGGKQPQNPGPFSFPGASKPSNAAKPSLGERLPKMLEAFKKHFDMDGWAVEALVNKPMEKFDEADLTRLTHEFKDMENKKRQASDLDAFKDLNTASQQMH